MSHAIFLGAGASKSFGFPLTSEILPIIRTRLKGGELFGDNSYDRRQERRLKVLLRSTFPGLGRIADKDLPLITEVLSLVDYSLSSGSVSAKSLSKVRLEELRRLLERAIVETLEPPYSRMDVPVRLRRFVDWIHGLAVSDGGVAIITTNYDISVEMELFYKSGQFVGLEDRFDFGLEWRNPWRDEINFRPKSAFCRIYKLHGSLNWLHCPLCGHVYVNTAGSIIHHAFREKPEDEGTCDCDYWPLEPLIVAPSAVRDVRNSNLVEVWKHSLEALRRADKWIIIGYSFPSEDIAIRSMFLRAYSGRPNKPDVEVIQLRDDSATKARYRILFPGCRYRTGGMEKFVDSLVA
jgi:hypothetical protein